MKYIIEKWSFLPALLFATVIFAQDRMDVSGSWRLALDWDDVGCQQGWYNAVLPGTDVLTLPGSLQAQGFGEKPTIDSPWTARIGMDVWRNNPRYTRHLYTDFAHTGTSDKQAIITDFEEMVRYTGVLKPKNFEIRKSLNDVAAIAILDILFDVDEAIRQGLIDPSGFSFENQ